MRPNRSKHQRSPQTKRMKRAKGGSMKNKDNPEDRFGKYRRSSASKSFPDLSGDGKVTKKDVLMGRGVIKKPRQMKLAGGMASGVRALKRAIGKPPKKRPMPRPKREEG